MVDLCGLANTLLVDFDGVYNPRHLNDRLVLGLKGTMSEFELAIIRQRSLEALKEKARRGELFTIVPIGYVRTSKDRCEKDPDLRIQHAVALVFEKFKETGSICQALLWFRQERVKHPTQEITAEGRVVVWRLPRYNTLHRILTNPFYAGAYVYGRTVTRSFMSDGRSKKTKGHQVEQNEWEVHIPDHHEGYVTWDEFERIQGVIHHNANMKGLMAKGAVRRGPALLAGLLRCLRCGRRLHVTYSGKNGRVPRYGCRGAMINHGEAKCISFGGLAIDRAIGQEVLRVMEPASLDAAIQLAKGDTDRHEAARQALELEVKAARYEADRARRQYDQVDPDNRLVASELERRWNDALAQVAGLETELARLPVMSEIKDGWTEEQIMGLAEEFPMVWNESTTDVALKKRLIRAVIEEILVDVDASKAQIRATIRWAGGLHTELEIRKNHTGKHRYTTDRQVIDLLTDLARITKDQNITHILNRLGLKTATGQAWTQSRVQGLRQRHGIPAYDPSRQEWEGWLTMEQAAKSLAISPMSVRRLLERGVLKGNQVVPYAPWIIAKANLNEPAVTKAVAAIKASRNLSLPECENQLNLDLAGLMGDGAL